MKITWIVVADSARARIFSVDGNHGEFQEVKQLVHPESRLHGIDIVTDKPGRTFNSAGPRQHAKTQSVDAREHEAEKFCKDLVREIESGRKQGKYEDLVLVAAPGFLGELRKSISNPTAKLVTRQIQKDFSKLKTSEIQERILPL